MKYIYLLSILFVVSCTSNQRAKQWGGKQTINLPANEKLINVTWKESNLWYLTRTMNAKDSAESYEFKEKSTYGVFEGTITIKEDKIVTEKLSYFDSLQNK